MNTLTGDIKCGKAKMDEFCLWNYVCMEVDGWNVLVVLWEVGDGWNVVQLMKIFMAYEWMDEVVNCEKHSFTNIKCGKAK